MIRLTPLLLLVGVTMALFLLPSQSKALAEILNIKTKFGAFGDGLHNDHNAFAAAAAYINNKKGNCILEIPTGTYKVGKQQKVSTPGNVRYLGENVFDLNGCTGVEIRCSNSTPAVIKFDDGMYFGTFSSNGRPISHPLPYTNTQDLSAPGNLFNLMYCNDITIKNIALNGNFYSGKVNIGGKYGDTDWQVYHTAISIIESNRIRVQQTNIDRFGLDGVYLSGGKNVRIQQCNITFCGRQGISWVSGDSLLVENTNINSIGKGLIGSSPAAGIDIEPNSNASCTNGIFNQVRIENCSGQCVVSDLSSGVAQHMTFTKCTFINTTNWSILVRNKDFVFRNCAITGCIVHACSAQNWADATKFISCNFNQCNQGKVGFYKWMVNIQQFTRVLFDSCTFTGYSKKLIHLTGSLPNMDARPIIRNCSFRFRGHISQLKEELAGDNTVAEFSNINMKNNTFYFNPYDSRIYGLESCVDSGNGWNVQVNIISKKAFCTN